jgi:hypothetical protein
VLGHRSALEQAKCQRGWHWADNVGWPRAWPTLRAAPTLPNRAFATSFAVPVIRIRVPGGLAQAILLASCYRGWHVARKPSRTGNPARTGNPRGPGGDGLGSGQECARTRRRRAGIDTAIPRRPPRLMAGVGGKTLGPRPRGGDTLLTASKRSISQRRGGTRQALGWRYHLSPTGPAGTWLHAAGRPRGGV